MLKTVSRIRGQVKETGYPQTEGVLGECMLLYGQQLGDTSEFGTISTTRRTKSAASSVCPSASLPPVQVELWPVWVKLCSTLPGPGTRWM